MSTNPVVAPGEALTSLIEVRPPYFALNDLRLERAGHVRARVTPEQPRHQEHGPVAAAEAGRHLAILGSCACASLEPRSGKHYYLAHRALLERTSKSVVPATSDFVVEAHGRRDKREASAECTLHEADGASLFALSVSYRVIPERVFQRMFAAHRRDLRTADRQAPDGVPSVAVLQLRRNPYVQPLPLDFEQVSGERGRAVLRQIPAQLCAGHFPLYPAMPIALLMHGLSTLCGAVLEARAGEPTHYVVTRGEVTAEQLAFAGQSLTFEACCVDDSDSRATFQTRALLPGGASVGEMRVTLERV